MDSGYRNQIIADAIALAERWLDRANELRTDEERLHQAQMQRLLEHPTDKVVLSRLIDRCFRTTDDRHVANQVHHLLTTHGVPAFFSTVERT